jgi:lysophospholipase L1-like esterase
MLSSAPVLATLGDSLTVGVGGDRSWVEFLAQALGARLQNLSANGARARTVLAEQLPAVDPAARWTTLLVGGNDVLRGDFDPAEVGASVRQLAQRVPGGTVLIVLPPSMRTPGLIEERLPLPGRFRRVLLDRLVVMRNAVLSGVPDDARVRLLDCDEILTRTGKSGVYVDRIHLSPLGHRLLALAAGRILTDRPLAPIAPPPRPPMPGYTSYWLVRNGLPWLAKRSRDLLPELVRVTRRPGDARPGPAAAIPVQAPVTVPVRSEDRPEPVRTGGDFTRTG